MMDCSSHSKCLNVVRYIFKSICHQAFTLWLLLRVSSMSNLYKVERIIGKKITDNGQVLYKVKWVGYPDSQCTWEPVRNLRAVQDMIDAFEKKNEKKLATLSLNHQQKLKNDSKQRPFPNAKAAQPRKLVKNSSEGPGKAVRSDQEKGSQLDEYLAKPEKQPLPIISKTIEPEEEESADVNLSLLQARIKQLAERKEEERVKIVDMYRNQLGHFTYEVLRGHRSSMESREYILEHCTDELIAFYESKISFHNAE